MPGMATPRVLWSPPADARTHTRVGHYLDWLASARSLQFSDYQALLRWSVDDLEGFWGSVAEYFEVDFDTPPRRVLDSLHMPGASWFPGARLNWAAHALRLADRNQDDVVVVAHSDTRPEQQLTVRELRDAVARIRGGLLRLGVRPGDRVAAYLPNMPEATIGLLATASIGAVWSSCAPEFGTRSVIDRFGQIEPTVLLTIDGYRYGGRDVDRTQELAAIRAALPSLKATVVVPYLTDGAAIPDAVPWGELAAESGNLAFEAVPFDHPLYVLFSSGTTGLPKPIVHGHGGILLETLKNATFHFDLHPREPVFYFTTTGWMLWNFLVSTPLTGAVPVLYDGHPAHPTPDVLWQMAQEAGVVTFGASPTYVDALKCSGVVPRERYGLEALRTINLAGSPASPECMGRFYRNVKEDLWVANGSGGTDCCTGFVGGVPTLPVRAGEIQAPSLGVSVEAFNARGESVVDEVGELVITEPMPSMPLRFWNDPGDRRYLETYFQEFPGVWRHGDFFKINARGGCYVLGRSDATLNRHGVRIGTAA